MVRLLRSIPAPFYLVPVVWLLFGPSHAQAQIDIFGHEICCPITWFCQPKPPKICYKCRCPKPVCNPCELENYGYYPTCWRPWMQQVNYSHCPVPPPTVLAPHYHPREELADQQQPDEQLLSPQPLPKLDKRPSEK